MGSVILVYLVLIGSPRVWVMVYPPRVRVMDLIKVESPRIWVMGHPPRVRVMDLIKVESPRVWVKERVLVRPPRVNG